MSGDSVSRPKRMTTRSSKSTHKQLQTSKKHQESNQEEAVSSTTVIPLPDEQVNENKASTETASQEKTVEVVHRRMSITDSDEEAISSVIDSSVVSNILCNMTDVELDTEVDMEGVDMESDLLSDRSLMASFTSLVGSGSSSSSTSPPMTRSGSMSSIVRSTLLKMKQEKKDSVDLINATASVIQTTGVVVKKEEPATVESQGKEQHQDTSVQSILGHKSKTGSKTTTTAANQSNKLNSNVSSSKSSSAVNCTTVTTTTSTVVSQAKATTVTANTSNTCKSGAKAKSSTTSSEGKGEFILIDN